MVRSAHILQAAVVGMLALGVLMVHSAGMNVIQPAGGVGQVPDPSAGSAFWLSILGGFAGRNTIYALLAIGAMLFASRIDVRGMFRSHGWTNPLGYILLLALVLTSLTLVPGLGRNVNGASRWLYLGPKSLGLSFQPSELVKWVLVVFVGWWCARRRGVMHSFRHGLLLPLVVIAVACGIIVKEDLGTAALIGLVCFCLLLAGGASWWQLGLLAPLAGLAGVFAIIHTPYRVARLTAFMDPWADPAGAGYHPIQSMLAFAKGGVLGSGLGNGVQKHGYLPEDVNDFIFPILTEELGLAGAAVVIVLILVILWVGIGIVRDCKDTFGRLVGLGVLLTFGLQAAINIAVVTVVVPTKGIALPFISAGGTGWIMAGFALGLVAALDNANHFEALDQFEGELVAAELDEEDDAALPDEDEVDPVPPVPFRLRQAV